MSKNLTKEQQEVLAAFESKLHSACRIGNIEEAEKIIKQIQEAFIYDRDHYRLLSAKNWYFEALLDTGKTKEAQRGFRIIQKRANERTRVYLEAVAFLGICALRLKNIDEAKEHIKYVLFHVSNITSDKRRRQYEIRFIDRIENEYILSQLIGQNRGKLIAKEIHKQSVEMVKKPEEEILASIGNCLSERVPLALNDITNYSIQLLPSKDQKLLTASSPVIPKRELGVKVLAAVKRISWRAFCEESSEIHKLWSNKLPEVFNEGYFTAAAMTVLAEWKIGIPQLAIGLVATTMKYSCQEFCESFKPKGLMISRKEKE